MRVAGIDCSSFAIDIVTIQVEDDPQPEWHRFELEGNDAFDRARSVGALVPGRAHSFWDEILAVGIEEPTGKWKPGSGFRMQGAVLSVIPMRMLVSPLTPSQWRAKVGLPGNCAKEHVFRWVTEQIGGRPRSQDAADAYCMALAMRRLLQEEKDGERAA